MLEALRAFFSAMLLIFPVLDLSNELDTSISDTFHGSKASAFISVQVGKKCGGTVSGNCKHRNVCTATSAATFRTKAVALV